MTLVVSVMLLVGVKVAVQVTPPSLLLTGLRVPFSTVRSPLAKPVTASLKVTVTRLVSPMRKAVSARVMDVSVGPWVSSVKLIVWVALTLPATSVWRTSTV